MKKFYLIPESQGKKISTSLTKRLYRQSIQSSAPFSPSLSNSEFSATPQKTCLPALSPALFPLFWMYSGTSTSFLNSGAQHCTQDLGWGYTMPQSRSCLLANGDAVCGACWDGACPLGCLSTHCWLTLSLLLSRNSPNPFHLCFFLKLKLIFWIYCIHICKI